MPVFSAKILFQVRLSCRTAATDMDHLGWLAMSILFFRLAASSDDGSYEVAMVLQSNSSTASGLVVSGKIVDVPTEDVSITLYATLLVNLTSYAQVRVDWYKDGQAVNVSIPFRRRYCDGLRNSSVMYTLNCTLGLPLSKVNDGVAGNYSLKYFPYYKNPVVIAWTTVITDRARRLEFTSFADPVVNCSSSNATVSLSYSASGFPRPTYSLNCSGLRYLRYYSSPASTGLFVLPRDLCNGNVTCQAAAKNDYQSLILSPVTMIVAVSRPSLQLSRTALLGRNFQVHPPDVLIADKPATNGTMVLQYVVAGAAAYTLYCNSTNAIGTAARANLSSASGTFTILPLPCGANTTCHAVASFIGGDSIISPDTTLLASACRPVATFPISEGSPNILLTVSLIVSITVTLALIAAITSCCRLRRGCPWYQLKVRTEAKQVDAMEAAVDPPTIENYSKKTDEFCTGSSAPMLYPNGINKPTRQEQMYSQPLTYSYPVGILPFSRLRLPNLSRDESHCLEMDCGDRSEIEPGPANCSGTRVTNDQDVSAEPASLSVEHYPSPTSPPTVIVIGASHVQLGNGNTMVCNNCISGLDRVTISLPDWPPEQTPEAEHFSLPGSWLPSDSCGSPEIHSTANTNCFSTDCLYPEVALDQCNESSLSLNLALA